MNNETKVIGVLITLIFAMALMVHCATPTVICLGDHNDDAGGYPYTEMVKIPIGNDILHLTTISLNGEEEINMLHSYLADGIVYSGEYEDAEALIEWCKEYPITNEEDEFYAKFYYQELIEEKIWE